MGRTGDDGSAKEAASAARATSFKSNDDDIEWEPDRRIYSGERKIKVKGPVKVKLQTNALSIDGLIYYVEWQPLDKNGNILPQFRGPNQPPKNRGRHVVPGNPDVQTFQPPYDHEHGFQVRIWIPPQQTPNGNTAGAYLDVFVPKGGKIK